MPNPPRRRKKRRLPPRHPCLSQPQVEPQWPAGPEGEAAKAYAEGNIAKARKIWEELAANGDGQAMNNLGVLYDQGKGTDPDVGQAINWFAKSARAGNPSGMSNYGRMLEQGRGLPANPEEAARWLDIAARRGSPRLSTILAICMRTGAACRRMMKRGRLVQQGCLAESARCPGAPGAFLSTGQGRAQKHFQSRAFALCRCHGRFTAGHCGT